MEDSSEKPKLGEKQPNSVEISMGTIFTVKVDEKETDMVNVITDIGEGDYFDAAILKKSKKGERYIVGGGTFRSDEFGRLIGNMSDEEVIEAKKLGAKITVKTKKIRRGSYELSRKELDILRASAKKGSRILIISPS